MGEPKGKHGAGYSMPDETTSVRVAVRVRPQVRSISHLVQRTEKSNLFDPFVCFETRTLPRLADAACRPGRSGPRASGTVSRATSPPAKPLWETSHSHLTM